MLWFPGQAVCFVRALLWSNKIIGLTSRMDRELLTIFIRLSDIEIKNEP